ncbi:hypothetical protein B0T18DRAFT_188024 [Schizothecium vesticola]|uniref:Uncharacterized protein n=1 Tax=Schizothecium vesticola TaxID=314040 RepID=A0AA40EQI6_9PEZI|nr:hypothetical protein B0T18DRAFT_188024 [Schizothecium vesticola]
MHPGSLGRASPVWRRASKMGSLITVFCLRSNAYALFHWVPVVSGCFESRDAWKCRAGKRGNRSQADEVKARGGIPFCVYYAVVLFLLSLLVFEGQLAGRIWGKEKQGLGGIK